MAEKYDQKKAMWQLLPWQEIESVVRVLEFGAEKYAIDGWKSVPDGRRRYFNAAIRHLKQWHSGEKIDNESGLPHLAHASCCLLFMMWLDENGERE
jgi:hypothetical protein